MIRCSWHPRRRSMRPLPLRQNDPRSKVLGYSVGVAVYKRGNVWWYKFVWNGEPIRASTKQSNKRLAEQIVMGHDLPPLHSHDNLRCVCHIPLWRYRQP
jgi:hypothetical protein